MARVVLVEGWYRGSHRAWADAVAHRSRHDVHLVTMPGVHWRWRIQGGAVWVADQLPGAVRSLGGIDVLLTTSAVDAAAVAGLARRSLGEAALVHYLHDNQITWPVEDDEDVDLTYAMATWRSMVAADLVLCNSAFHRSELFGAVPDFLRRFPDRRGLRGVGAVAARTHVVRPGVDVARFRHDRPDAGGGPCRVLWNHRWERDKDPARFVAAMIRLVESDRDVELVVAGPNLDLPAATTALGPVRDHLAHLGTATDDEYAALLRTCDVVVSTARHEFFGIAVAEAMAAGCAAVLPNALAYPELVPDALHDAVLYDDDEGLDRLLASAVDDLVATAQLGRSLQRAMASVDLDACIATLDDHLDEVVGAVARR